MSIANASHLSYVRMDWVRILCPCWPNAVATGIILWIHSHLQNNKNTKDEEQEDGEEEEDNYHCWMVPKERQQRRRMLVSESFAFLSSLSF